MQQLLNQILNADTADSRPIADLMVANPLVVAVLAPHPDDFDAIGITMRALHRAGHQIHVAVVTHGASGVEQGWHGARSDQDKAAIREAEQRASCRFFGLAPDRLSFLRLWDKDHDGDAGCSEPPDTASDAHRNRLRDYLLALNPDLVFLPHGNDSNRTHRRTYECFNSIALQEGMHTWACLNQDAKTIAMRPDLYACFDEEDAHWKGELLRHHQSQHERNLKARGVGFDQRVLAVNRRAASEGGRAQPYAEVFELKRYGR